MTTLTSNMLRGLIRDAIPGAECYGGPFAESSHDDGCMHGTLESVHDGFDVRIPLREFLAARFGCRESEVSLSWDPYYWRYTAVLPVTLTSAERQKLEEYDD